MEHNCQLSVKMAEVRALEAETRLQIITEKWVLSNNVHSKGWMPPHTSQGPKNGTEVRVDGIPMQGARGGASEDCHTAGEGPGRFSGGH